MIGDIPLNHGSSTIMCPDRLVVILIWSPQTSST